MSDVVVLRNTNPLGYVDVPELRREGPSDHPSADEDGVGCLYPDEEFETTQELAGYPPAEDGSHPGAGLLAQVGNYEHVSGDLLEPPTVEPEGVEIPDGEPSNSWTKPALLAYAEQRGIDLGDAKTKPQVLEAIGAATNPEGV